jgi:ArsR family transcriptional regulator
MDKQLLKEINQLHAEVCGGLADPKRIAILYAIADNPQSVSQLAEALDTAQPTISRHLKILRDHGMVIAERDGTNVYYMLSESGSSTRSIYCARSWRTICQNGAHWQKR